MTFALKSIAVAAALGALDAWARLHWGSLVATLGPLLGLELGLLLFLHALGLLLILDLLENRARIPGTAWFYRLPVGRGPARDGAGLPANGWRRRGWLFGGRLAGTTLVFYLLETLVIPFLPGAGSLHYEGVLILLAGSALLWQPGALLRDRSA